VLEEPVWLKLNEQVNEDMRRDDVLRGDRGQIEG
jgi:hypothetical protein